jgi:UDP-N-acetylglucosamine acyltransferase
MTIHPTALVETGAQVDPTATIGPYCCIGPQVTIGPGVTLFSHVTISGITEIGEGTQIYPFASIGYPPQDLKYEGEPSRLIIGKKNILREYVTIQPGTKGGGMLTQVGDHNLFMVGVHIAHDCRIGNHIVMANNATLAGHVSVGDRAIIGGLSGIRQFVRIGAHAMIGGLSGVENDVIPFGMVVGERGYLSGLNLVGLKRLGLPRDDIHLLRGIYRDLFKETTPFTERLEEIERKFSDNSQVMTILAFIKQDSERSLCMPRVVED